MKIATLMFLSICHHAAFAASVTATAGKNQIWVTWNADTPLKYVTVCSKPGQLNPTLVCSGANQDGDVKKTLQPPASSGTEELSHLDKNKWYTIKVKGIAANQTMRKQIGVIKIKTQK